MTQPKPPHASGPWCKNTMGPPSSNNAPAGPEIHCHIVSVTCSNAHSKVVYFLVSIDPYTLAFDIQTLKSNATVLVDKAASKNQKERTGQARRRLAGLQKSIRDSAARAHKAALTEMSRKMAGRTTTPYGKEVRLYVDFLTESGMKGAMIRGHKYSYKREARGAKRSTQRYEKDLRLHDLIARGSVATQEGKAVTTSVFSASDTALWFFRMVRPYLTAGVSGIRGSPDVPQFQRELKLWTVNQQNVFWAKPRPPRTPP